MKFSFTLRGQLTKLIHHLNDQNVFDENWNVLKPTDIKVISLNLDISGSPISSHTPTETLFQFLSDGKTKYGLGTVIGMTKVGWNLDEDSFQEVLEICRERLDTDYKHITWLDFTMVLLVSQLYPHDSDLYQWSKNHQKMMFDKNNEIGDYFTKFSTQKVSPVF